MLDLENVNAYYGDSHILHGVSLAVKEGEVVCLLGRNGAGKTTTILTIMPMRNDMVPSTGTSMRAQICCATSSCGRRRI